MGPVVTQVAAAFGCLASGNYAPESEGEPADCGAAVLYCRCKMSPRANMTQVLKILRYNQRDTRFPFALLTPLLYLFFKVCVYIICVRVYVSDSRRKYSFTVLLYIFSLLKHRAYKTIEDEDLKFPLIYGEGKKVSVCVCVRLL